MTRAAGGNVQVVKATNNVYTVLVAVAIVVEIVGLVSLFMRSGILFPKGGLLGG